MTVSVGYAFREKRIKSLFTPELIAKGLETDVTFTKIDPCTPIVEQGKFDVVLHKLEVLARRFSIGIRFLHKYEGLLF